jgi:hypothetical protein
MMLAWLLHNIIILESDYGGAWVTWGCLWGGSVRGLRTSDFGLWTLDFRL